MFAFRRTLVRRRVLVNLKSEKAFRGVLWAKRGPLLVLRNAVLFEGRRTPVRVDGEVVLERNHVDFIQILPGQDAPASTPPPEE